MKKEHAYVLQTSLAGLKKVLARKQHDAAFAPVLQDLILMLEMQKEEPHAQVKVARQSDVDTLAAQIKSGLKALEVSEETPVKTVIDKTLIGGFTVTFDYKEYDRSYKKVLTSLYGSITK